MPHFKAKNVRHFCSKTMAKRKITASNSSKIEEKYITLPK
jgi:hypothetical protein